MIKPLATNMSLKEILDKMKEKVISKFESKISEQNNKIYELESRAAIQEETVNNLLIKCDDNEQYIRCSCLRIYGNEGNTSEKNGDVIEKIKECYNALELPFNEEVIDRGHRVGKEYTDKISKKKVKSAIVKFKSWKARQKLYNARPRVRKDGKKKPRQIFSISVDLSRNRYQLLSKASGVAKDINAINFAFANIYCSVGVRYDNSSFDHFNSEQELRNIINKFN